MMDDEQKKKRRLLIVDIYKRSYCVPLCKALIKHSDEVQRLSTRCSDFTRAVQLADPNGKWHKKFNRAFLEIMDELGMEQEMR